MSKRCSCPICKVKANENYRALHQFEAWVRSCTWHWRDGKLPSFEYSVAPGYYKDPELMLCWEAWRASAHALQPDEYFPP